MDELLSQYPVLFPTALGLIAILFANGLLALLPLVGGGDAWFPRN